MNCTKASPSRTVIISLGRHAIRGTSAVDPSACAGTRPTRAHSYANWYADPSTMRDLAGTLELDPRVVHADRLERGQQVLAGDDAVIVVHRQAHGEAEVVLRERRRGWDPDLAGIRAEIPWRLRRALLLGPQLRRPLRRVVVLAVEHAAKLLVEHVLGLLLGQPFPGERASFDVVSRESPMVPGGTRTVPALAGARGAHPHRLHSPEVEPDADQGEAAANGLLVRPGLRVGRVPVAVQERGVAELLRI